MATIGLSGGLAAAFGNWIENARHQFNDDAERRRIYRQTHAELSSLSDRDLEDIGVSRLQIGDIAREAAYGDRR